MSLNISTEPIENRQLAVSIEVDQARVEKELRKAARKLARDYRIPGFRRGKAPYQVIVQNMGLSSLYGEFVDELGQEVFREALEESDLQPYAQASLEDVSFEPLTYKLVIPLEPEVILGDYRSLRVEEEPVEIDEEQIEARLEKYREENAGWQEVDRPSQYGDLMNMDVRSVIPGEEGEEETVVLDETDWDITPDNENPMEPPGFDEMLLDMVPNDEKEFALSWPADSQSIYAGKTAHFTVRLNNNKAHVKPELDDELAQLVGPDFETLEDLRNSIRESLIQQAEAEAESTFVNRVLDEVLAQSQISYPPAVVEDQLDALMDDFGTRLTQFGFSAPQDYFDQADEDMDEFRENQREQATLIAERNLIISELVAAEMIAVTDDDIEAKIATVVGPGGESEEEKDRARSMSEMLRSGVGRPMLEAQLLHAKTVERLLAIVRGEEVPDLEALALEAQSDGDDAQDGEADTDSAVTIDAVADEQE